MNNFVKQHIVDFFLTAHFNFLEFSLNTQSNIKKVRTSSPIRCFDKNVRNSWWKWKISWDITFFSIETAKHASVAPLLLNYLPTNVFFQSIRRLNPLQFFFYYMALSELNLFFLHMFFLPIWRQTSHKDFFLLNFLLTISALFFQRSHRMRVPVTVR